MSHDQASLNSYIWNLHELDQIRALFIYRIRACTNFGKKTIKAINAINQISKIIFVIVENIHACL